MAMTKKEKAAVEAEINALKLKLALHWTEPASPDVPPPCSTSDLTKGYMPVFDRVEEACSTSIRHGVGSQRSTTSQGSRYLYSTRLLALRALRNVMENRAAQELRRVDRWIELEIANAVKPSEKEG